MKRTNKIKLALLGFLILSGSAYAMVIEGFSIPLVHLPKPQVTQKLSLMVLPAESKAPAKISTAKTSESRTENLLLEFKRARAFGTSC